MVKLGILEPYGASKWAFSTFIIPKKMDRFDKSLIYIH